ncbi:type II secretion system protein [Vibrio hannami]|uniref:type II secretion system protein n=1 Tax=Vibrio hannami TaxID=2717094 RepID=UPI00240FA051|nr:type II secretion system protein [Vibrio hannami]MDG3084791.1 type II secretion system protein [Vibrio hannami]
MKASYRQSGFTLIELVVVIILLGIISTYAASRYIGKSSFSTFAAQEQAISIIRQIQLGRMYSNVSDATAVSESNYRLSVSSDCLGSVSSCASGASDSSNRLTVDDGNLSFSSTLSPVTFDLLGNPLSAAGELLSAPVTITISNGSESNRVCINPQGYVYGC